MDLEKATYTNDVGSVELKTVWTDPEFDASLHAFYYARVLEIPTPRWTLIQAVKSGLPPPNVVPLTGQERAWTSPIWYTPSAEARKGAPAGMTVADLRSKGATPLSEEQLKALVVGKAFWMRNNVIGEQFFQAFTAEGQMNVFRVGANEVVPSHFGNVGRDGYQGTTSAYKIEGDKLIVLVSQDPYDFAFYKLGSTYYAARNNEFGYANYEIIAAPLAAANPLTALSNQFSMELGLTAQQKREVVPDPGTGDQATRRPEEGHQVERPAKGGGAQEGGRVLRREDLAASQSGTAAEVRNDARGLSAPDDRGDGREGAAKGGVVVRRRAPGQALNTPGIPSSMPACMRILRG